MHNVDQIRQNLLDKDRGFHVLRSFFSMEESLWLRADCQQLLKNGPVLHTRINTDTIHDYVQPRSHDTSERTYRMYRYFHNHKQDEFGRLLHRAVGLREEVESTWSSDAVYEQEREQLQDYVIVTSYKQNAGMLPVHRDYDGPARFPLIQFWVLLSQPNIDYGQGNLILYSASGRRYCVERDLGLQVGDALVFDKSLEHEVEVTTRSTESEIGRWTILIVARAKRHHPLRAAAKQILFSPSLYPVTRFARRLISRQAA